MKYRTLDDKGDYTLGRSDFKTGREAVAQAVLTRLRLLYAEWWENLDDGLPLFEKILGVRGTAENIQAVDLSFSQRIMKTTGVKGIVSYHSEFNSATRHYQAICVINTLYGEEEITIDATNATIEVSY